MNPTVVQSAKVLQRLMHQSLCERIEMPAQVIVHNLMKNYGPVEAVRGVSFEVAQGEVFGMPVFDEETFGPVAALIDARGVDDAIRLANLSKYGLGASIWTRDAAAAQLLAARLEAGCVFVNGPVKSDPRLPFGGIKRSGYGRELSAFGIHEFVNIKTVWMR